MISDGRHNRLVVTLISLLILSFIYQIFFFDERKIITGVGQYNKKKGWNLFVHKISKERIFDKFVFEKKFAKQAKMTLVSK